MQTVDKESMVQAEGFNLKKYEDLFFDTMDEEELEEWTNRLPDHPKLPAKTKKRALTPVDEEESEDEEEYEVIGGAGESLVYFMLCIICCALVHVTVILLLHFDVTTKYYHHIITNHWLSSIPYIIHSPTASSKAKTAKAKKTSNKQSNKKRKKQSKKTKDEEEDLDSDGEDGIPGGKLRLLQKQLFDTWLEGKAEFDSFSSSITSKKKNKSSSAPKSLKQTKAIVKTTMKVIVENEHGNDKMTKFKRERGDPIARKVKTAIGEYVKEQAAILERELLEDMLLDKYEVDEEEVVTTAAMTDESGGEEMVNESGDSSPDNALSDGGEVEGEEHVNVVDASTSIIAS